MKKIGILILLLILLAGAEAQTPTLRVPVQRLSNHIITLNILDDGSARVEEEYFFNFYEGEPQQLVKDFQENTPSLDFWRADYSYIHNYFGTPTSVSEVSFELGETPNGQPSLKLNYKSSDKIFIPTPSSTRTELWELNDSSFSQFIQAGTILIPDNTIIRIIFPVDSEIIQKNLPSQVVVSGNSVTINNFRGSKLPLSFLQINPIAPPFDFNKIAGDFLASPFSYVIFTFMVIVLAFVFIKREDISQKIEEFVVQHSEISTKKEEEAREEEIDV